MTQSDKQDLQKELSDKADLLLKEIHQHLEQQDKKIDEILRRLNKWPLKKYSASSQLTRSEA